MFCQKAVIRLKAKLFSFASYCFNLRLYGPMVKFIALIARVNYHFYLDYRDDDLEALADKLATRCVGSNNVTVKENFDDIIFYDAYGWANRGLTEQYLQALVKHKNITYIYDGTQFSPDKSIIKLLESNQCQILLLNHTMALTKRVTSIKNLARFLNPGMIFIHAAPSSFTPFIIRKVFASSKLVNINITDHAYWLGYSIMDTILEFRKFGGFVSTNGRGIGEEKIQIIPFHPHIETTNDIAADLSFIEADKLTIFTGGDFSKINSEGDTFFLLMKEIVERYENSQICVAGGGDPGRLVKFIKDNDLDGKIIYIGFRKDLAAVMAQIDIYLSTFPIGGGLMNAYAIANKKPIMSLVDRKLQHTFIENQYDIPFSVSYTERNEFFSELTKLVNVSEYRVKQGERLAKFAATGENFSSLLKQFLDKNLPAFGTTSSYDIDLKKSREIAFDAEKNGNGKFHRVFIKELRWLSILFPKLFVPSLFKLFSQILR